LAVNKAKKAPKGKSEFRWDLHMGTFRKLLLILPSRRLKVRLISFYKQKVVYVTNITKTANSVKRILGISFRPKFRQKILDAPTYWRCFWIIKSSEIVPISALGQNFGDKKYIQTLNDYG